MDRCRDFFTVKDTEMAELGDIVRDTISGYEGVVIGVTQWIYGCRRLTVQAKGLKDGKPIDAINIDEPQCIVKKVADPTIQLAETGGPQVAAVTRHKATTKAVIHARNDRVRR